MDDKLDAFRKSLVGVEASRLDFSPGSLTVIESWLLGNEYLAPPDALTKPHRYVTVNGLCQYVGEVYRRALGGHWDMSLGSVEGRDAGPFLTGLADGGAAIAPLQLVMEAHRTRRAGFLLERLEHRAARSPGGLPPLPA